MTPERWQQIKRLYESALKRDESERRRVPRTSLRRRPGAAAGSGIAARLSRSGNDGFIETPALEVAARALAPRPAESLLGRQLGSYKILSLLGAGGHGRGLPGARHASSGARSRSRSCPKLFARDPERLARFRREAHLLASLNHPNIAAIYGLEESDGVRYLVLELVPGETLAERVAAGPLDVNEALRICGQIAEGLEAAHEKGIIHRDLKPANIKVTPEGKVKVLDFGLAKAFAGRGTGSFAVPRPRPRPGPVKERSSGRPPT